MVSENSDMSETAQSPTITVETTYRTRGGERTEEYELDVYEVEEVLELALRGSLEDVDARTIANEVEARGREQ